MSNQNSNNKDRVLVYSTDPKDQAIIDGSAEKNQKNATVQQLVDSKKFVIVFRIETNSRGGKTVTVLDKLPPHELFVKELTKELKVKCGTGGSYKISSEYATIEIQGDKRQAIKGILDSKQIKYKGM